MSPFFGSALSEFLTFIQFSVCSAFVQATDHIWYSKNKKNATTNSVHLLHIEKYFVVVCIFQSVAGAQGCSAPESRRNHRHK